MGMPMSDVPRSSPEGARAACCGPDKPAKSVRIKSGRASPRGPRRERHLMASMQTTGFSMKSFRLLTAIAFLAAAPWPALAADPVFPQGVRIGLTPLVGLVGAKSFSGFESEDQSVKVLVTELPADAYGEVKN